MEKLSFVIPCYGSETTIEIVVNEIRDMGNCLSYISFPRRIIRYQIGGI